MENISIVDREDRQIPDILDTYADKLDDIIDVSSLLLDRYLKKNIMSDDKLVPVLFFRNALEYVDSVSILVRNSSIEPIKAINRILLENLFQFEYLLEKDVENRSYAFLVWDIKQKLSFYKKIDKDSDGNKPFKKLINKDKLLEDISVLDNISVTSLIQRYSEILKLDGYKEANIEYEKTKKKNKFSPNWYSLYSGPKNVSDLAKNLNRTAHYEIFYREMSNNIHSTDIFKNKLVSKHNISYLTKLRNPFEADKVIKDTLNFLMSMVIIFLDELLPEEFENFVQWYASFKDFFVDIGMKEDFIVAGTN